MATNQEKLLEIFNNDILGLLEIKEKPIPITTDDRLEHSFNEINDFYGQYDREPEKSSCMLERKLFSRLQGIRDSSDKIKHLKQIDKYNLLSFSNIPAKEKFESVDDIINSNSFDAILDSNEDIFSFNHTPKTSQDDRGKADMVSRRKPCDNFKEYEHLFKKRHADLKNGTRTTIKFSEDHLKEGVFFIVKGVMTYLARIYNVSKDKNSKLDGRTLVIFENGTQSNMLYRSLGKSIYEDGYTISEDIEDIQNKKINNTYKNIEDDKKTGFIYILKSRSKSPKISSLTNLYKIGLSTTTVEERIKGAENDPTYLMASVSIVSTYECYNMNTKKFEALIHRFFKESCLDITINDKKGKAYKPQEWFVVPFDVIEQAIGLIISKDIISYKYDSYKEKIVRES